MLVRYDASIFCAFEERNTLDMDELRVALIGGGGFMGKTHSLGYAMAPIARDLGIKIRKQVLVDVDEDRAQAAADALGWVEAASDWEAVVARDDIDIVDIVTPPHLHARIARAALAAGKAVFCEKPITNDAAEALDLVEAARAAGAITQVGYNYRHTAAIRYIKSLLDDGTLGRPLQFRSTYLDDCKFLVDDMGWRDAKSRGASGVLGDLGSHAVDIAEYLVGPITSVSAHALSYATDGTGQIVPGALTDVDTVDDGGMMLVTFDRGAIGTFSTSFHASGRKNQLIFEIDCSKGAVIFDWNKRDEIQISLTNDAHERSGFSTVHMSEFQPDPWWEMGGLGSGYLETTTEQFASFIRAVREDRAASPDFASAARVQQIIEAALTSSRTGALVTVPTEGAAVEEAAHV
jgi:predicted dehydrogenase